MEKITKPEPINEGETPIEENTPVKGESSIEGLTPEEFVELGCMCDN